MFNVIKPLVFVFFVGVKIVRGISPRFPNLNGALHRTIHWGLRLFGSPDANFLSEEVVVCSDHAALAGRNRLARMKRKDTQIS